MLEPLSEYVKIEPQHLGVGQYQHDIAQKKLSSRLEDIVSEAVSFTGNSFCSFFSECTLS